MNRECSVHDLNNVLRLTMSEVPVFASSPAKKKYAVASSEHNYTGTAQSKDNRDAMEEETSDVSKIRSAIFIKKVYNTGIRRP